VSTTYEMNPNVRNGLYTDTKNMILYLTFNKVSALYV